MLSDCETGAVSHITISDLAEPTSAGVPQFFGKGTSQSGQCIVWASFASTVDAMRKVL